MTHERDPVPAASLRRPSIAADATGRSADQSRTRRPDPASAADHTAQQCQSWLDQHAEACRLMLEWGRVEARLQTEFGWYRMSQEERKVHPGQAELDGIQTRVDELVASRDDLLLRLPDLPAATPGAVALKLAIVAELVDVADHPEAKALIARAREDVLAL